MLKIGFANKFYTLWDVNIKPEYTTIAGKDYHTHDVVNASYIKNISMDKQVVISKYPDFENMLDESLRGKSRSFEYRKNVVSFNPDDITVFNFGKYADLTIEEVFEKDPKYLVWVKENFIPMTNYTKALIDNINKFMPLSDMISKEEKEKEDKLNSLNLVETGMKLQVTEFMKGDPGENDELEDYIATAVSLDLSKETVIRKVFFFPKNLLKYRLNFNGRDYFSVLSGDGKFHLIKNRNVTMEVVKIDEFEKDEQIVEIYGVEKVISIIK